MVTQTNTPSKTHTNLQLTHTLRTWEAKPSGVARHVTTAHTLTQTDTHRAMCTPANPTPLPRRPTDVTATTSHTG